MKRSSSRRREVLEALEIQTWSRRRPAAAAASEHAASPASPPGPAADVPAPRPASAAPAEAAPAPPSAPKPALPRIQPQPEVPGDWNGLGAAVAGCRQCKLCQTRANTVFGVGLQIAPLMVVGEGPGADEDAQGEPFVGRAGKLLDEMLKAIGRSRKESDANKSVYIANVVKCRPPGNRDPEPDEVEACRPYLDRQIQLLRPKLLVALGRVAAQRLLSTDAPLSKLRGPLYEYGPEHTPVLITYHPAYLLRSPGEKAKSWQDLKRIHQFLEGRG